MYDILNRINSPADVKELNAVELEGLASDVRDALFNRLTKIGGHFGPNFGIVEATIALHYVFSSPVDKIIFDVSHQSYTHKMLTGRKNGYIVDEDFSKDSGYTNPDESEHDLFNIGHTSTSISLATGVVKARDLKREKYNVIALIGDGSLSGGEALEGLNVAGAELNSNLIIIVNDNQMSIAETHGGIYKSLKALRESNGESSNNIFKAFGLDYMYVNEGNNIQKLIEAFKKVKDIDHPIVVHINTIKGNGYKFATENKEAWHYTSPFNKETGERYYVPNGESYVSIVKDFILNKAKKDPSFVALCPDVPGNFGLNKQVREELGEHYLDVGIAEEQAVAMASGVAKNGGTPLVLSSATFMQRTYDQVSHDVGINNSPVTILLSYSGMNDLRDISHLGIFAVSTFNDIPNIVILCPSSKDELLQALEWSTTQKEHPVIIVMPSGKVVYRESKYDFNSINKFELVKKGEKVALIGLGDFFTKAQFLAVEMKDKLGFEPTLINPSFASGVDKDLLDKLALNHKVIVTLENGVKDNGLGEKIASYLGDKDIKVLNYGLEKKFIDRYEVEDLLEEIGLTSDKIIKRVSNLIK